MKVLIAAINAKYSHTCLAAYILKTQLALHGIECTVFEASINDRLRDVAYTLFSASPTHILFPMYIWNRESVLSLAADIRMLLPGSVIIAGGPEAASPGIQTSPLFDAVIDGECENSIAPYLLDTADKKAGTPTPELVSFPPSDFAHTPFPYNSGELASFNTKIAYYESIRGCPYTCGYCISGSSSHSACRRKSLEAVIKDVDRFLEHPPGMVKFVDRTFNLYRDHAHGIWTYLSSLPADAPDLTFHFELHPGRITDEDIAVLGELPHGRVQVEVGVQSVTPQVLKASGRGGQSDWTAVKEMLIKLNKLPNVRTHLDQILGLPFSDAKESAHSMDEILSTRPRYFQLGFLKILHNTDFKRNAGKMGIIHAQAPPYEIYRTNWLTENEVALFHRIEWAVDALHNGGEFPNTLAYLCKGGSFEFYRAFASAYVPDDYRTAASKKWDRLADAILGLFQMSDDAAVVADLLRLDWCLVSKSSLYPEGIEPYPRAQVDAERAAVWASIKGSGFKGLPPGFSMRLYNKSILFSASTKEGKISAGGMRILFIPDESSEEKAKIKYPINSDWSEISAT